MDREDWCPLCGRPASTMQRVRQGMRRALSITVDATVIIALVGWLIWRW